MTQQIWHRQGPCKPSSCTTLTLSSHWGRAATGKTILLSMHTGLLQWCPTFCDPVDYGLPDFSAGGFSRQAYWSVLANIGCHTLPEHYTSFWKYFLLPEPLDSSSCTTSICGAHRGKPKSSRTVLGANPSG